jgi:hypothetical protein
MIFFLSYKGSYDSIIIINSYCPVERHRTQVSTQTFLHKNGSDIDKDELNQDSTIKSETRDGAHGIRLFFEACQCIY